MGRCYRPGSRRCAHGAIMRATTSCRDWGRTSVDHARAVELDPPAAGRPGRARGGVLRAGRHPAQRARYHGRGDGRRGPARRLRRRHPLPHQRPGGVRGRRPGLGDHRRRPPPVVPVRGAQPGPVPVGAAGRPGGAGRAGGARGRRPGVAAAPRHRDRLAGLAGRQRQRARLRHPGRPQPGLGRPRLDRPARADPVPGRPPTRRWPATRPGRRWPSCSGATAPPRSGWPATPAAARSGWSPRPGPGWARWPSRPAARPSTTAAGSPTAPAGWRSSRWPRAGSLDPAWTGDRDILAIVGRRDPAATQLAVDTGSGCGDRRADLSGLDGGPGRPLLPSASRPTSAVGWLDTRRVLLVEGGCEGPFDLWLVDVNGGEPKPVARGIDRAALRWPDPRPRPGPPDLAALAQAAG